jgi:hypothetical protein
MSLDVSEQPVRQEEISDQKKRPSLGETMGPAGSSGGSSDVPVSGSPRESRNCGYCHDIVSVPRFFGSGSMAPRSAWIDLMVLRGSQSGGFGL